MSTEESPDLGSERARGPSASRLEALRDELDARNVDNVARTESYLELYALTRAEPPDLPWLLLAHFVSRNAGYMMAGLRTAIEDRRRVFEVAALEELFLYLERANYLIFYDAWHHVLTQRLGTSVALCQRTPAFVRAAYARYEKAAQPSPETERQLVFDLIENEQNYIENRVVHHPRHGRARSLVSFFEAIGASRSMRFGEMDSGISVGRFADLARRIHTGQRLFRHALADRGRRRALYEWARQHPHTGSPSDHGGKPGIALREGWPVEQVVQLDPLIHAPPEPDPDWP